jgi:transposase
MENKRRKFGSELKAQIVLQILKGESTIAEESRKHHITDGLIHKWRTQFLENASKTFEVGKEDQVKDRKIKKYEHVITKITTQNDFLEKVLAHLE